jgi:hypothetical protein
MVEAHEEERLHGGTAETPGACHQTPPRCVHRPTARLPVTNPALQKPSQRPSYVLVGLIFVILPELRPAI